MGFLDALLGRTPAAPPNLDVLFTVAPAACTLQAALALHPSGVGAVCFRDAEGGGARRSREEILALLRLDPELTTEVTADEYGFTWIVCRRPSADTAALVTALHAINATLSDNGFGSLLLCTVIGFVTDDPPPRRLGLVYLFKRGTFYPFAPSGPQRRDTVLELRARAALSRELPIEPDLERWFPLWNAPAP
ncbi:PspA-associated protein PspAB [Nocardia sp. IFM 10818]